MAYRIAEPGKCVAQTERSNGEPTYSSVRPVWRRFLLPLWHICVKGVVPLSNILPQYMYSSNITDMSHMFLPRFVIQIFAYGKNLLMWALMCVFIRLQQLTTDFLLWTARPLWFLVASYDGITVTLMYNGIQPLRGQQCILVLQWRLTSENVDA